MGVLDSFLNNRKKVIPASARFRITEEGRERLQDFDGGSEARILIALETHGSSNVDTIANVGRVNRGTVERLIPKLVHQGCVQYVSSVPSSDESGG
jgi:predicted ArsR family transcriptional regulator